MKMEKTPRYTQRERNMVLGFAAQYKDVIENKRTDAESNRKKDEVWRQIAKEFNARVYHQRSSKQLRQLYKNMKLLLKKDLCGEGKGNRSFMDLLNTLSQQESVAQYISEQMSPDGYSSSRLQKYDDDYDDSKPSGAFDNMDTDVIVIKSEDISDNDQSQNGGDMDDDDDDCLSPKDIPEVCLEEEDDEIFATDLRQPLTQQQQQQQQQQQRQPNTQQQPEVTIQNIGGIRVGSIGSLANLKALQNGGNNSALSITHANNNTSSSSSNNNNNNNNTNNNNNNNNNISNNNHNNSGSSSHNNNGGGSGNHSNRQLNAEQQAQQHLLLNGLGLSAVHAPSGAGVDGPQLPMLQRGSHAPHHTMSNSTNQLLLSLTNSLGGSGGAHQSHAKSSRMGGSGNNHHSNNHSNGGSSSHNNDLLMSLAIEERKRKIDLLNAQIDYWKTLTKKLEANAGHNPSPTCMCHFPGKVNGSSS